MAGVWRLSIVTCCIGLQDVVVESHGGELIGVRGGNESLLEGDRC